MINPFKKIVTKHEVPKILKHKILDDIKMINLTFKVADFFLIKSPQVISDFYIKTEIVTSKDKNIKI